MAAIGWPVFAFLIFGERDAFGPGLSMASPFLGGHILTVITAGDGPQHQWGGLMIWSAAWIVLLAPILWEPGPGVAAAVCALALWRPRIALALAVPVAAGLGWFFQMPWEAMARQLAWLPLLLPAALVPERERIATVLTAALMAATVPQVPDLSTLSVVPWEEDPTAQVICDLVHQDGRVVEFTPRNVLKRVVASYAEDGLRPVVAPEIE